MMYASFTDPPPDADTGGIMDAACANAGAGAKAANTKLRSKREAMGAPALIRVLACPQHVVLVNVARTAKGAAPARGR
jgi:hypothetical protein